MDNECFFSTATPGPVLFTNSTHKKWFTCDAIKIYLIVLKVEIFKRKKIFKLISTLLKSMFWISKIGSICMIKKYISNSTEYWESKHGVACLADRIILCYYQIPNYHFNLITFFKFKTSQILNSPTKHHVNLYVL